MRDRGRGGPGPGPSAAGGAGPRRWGLKCVNACLEGCWQVVPLHESLTAGVGGSGTDSRSVAHQAPQPCASTISSTGSQPQAGGQGGQGGGDGA